jgi:hypothetical protein
MAGLSAGGPLSATRGGAAVEGLARRDATGLGGAIGGGEEWGRGPHAVVLLLQSADLLAGLFEFPPGLSEFPPGLSEFPPGLSEFLLGLLETLELADQLLPLGTVEGEGEIVRGKDGNQRRSGHVALEGQRQVSTESRFGRLESRRDCPQT